MEKLSGKELLEKFHNILDETDCEVSSFYYEDYTEETQLTLETALGEFTTVESGYTGKFDEDYKEELQVVHFIKHDVYIAMYADYNSWVGGKIRTSKYFEVEPVEVTKIEYRRVK
jgi:hypothetical protein